jgi:hypothetical protein
MSVFHTATLKLAPAKLIRRQVSEPRPSVLSLLTTWRPVSNVCPQRPDLIHDPIWSVPS